MASNGFTEGLNMTERLKELLKFVKHVAIATVNEDGSPHNTPVFAAFDDELDVYWSSDPNSLHSKNIERTGQVFIVVFESGGGLYIQAKAHQVSEGELDNGLAVFNKSRKRLLREEIPREYFIDGSPQRLFVAESIKIWTNQSEKDAQGRVIRDRRVELK
jgi:uncharacterized pyridoxamine 5'-phosphate oxidase family protein